MQADAFAVPAAIPIFDLRAASLRRQLQNFARNHPLPESYYQLKHRERTRRLARDMARNRLRVVCVDGMLHFEQVAR